MTPRELALELLRHRFRNVEDDAAHLEGLAAFQRLAVPRLEQALERYGGALLADSVGLGKTHVGAAVVRRAAARGEGAALIVPTSLRRQWLRALRGTDGVPVATHAQLSRGGRAALERASLVVVDEAHAFRNPRTQRYAALARLTAGRRTLLITATPVNNSLRDLYWLLRLFAADDAFAAVGVSDLAICVRDAERAGRCAALAAVLAEVAVRRTRDEVMDGVGPLPEATAAGGAPRLHFPVRAPPVAIPYAVPAALQRTLLDCIEQLELAPWSVLGPPPSALLLRLVLLKRLESSRAAFVASATRLLRTLRAFGEAVQSGHLLTPEEQRTRLAGDLDQLALEALVLRPLPRSLDADALGRAAASDCARLERALRQLREAPPDPKLGRLRRLVLEELRGRPVLVFTEFRDTARALWRELHTRVPTALIHGGGAWLGLSPVARRVVVDRFAPLSNGAAPAPARERPLVLVATDVMAEGLNLQDAADLVSYDLPWNPVRLLQRLGRIDRLGSPHAVVRGHYFSPGPDVEAMLRLMGRLRAKLAAIRGSIGEEGAVLADGRHAVPRAGRPSSADRLFADEERLRRLFLAADAATDPLAGLPLAAGAAPAPGHRARNPDPGARPPGILDLTVSGWPYGRGVILFFEYQGRQRAVRVGSRTFEELPAVAEVLATALGQRDVADSLLPAEARLLVDRARDYLARPRPAPRRHSRVQALRRRLLDLLGARPGGPTAAECRRADELLAALRRPLGVGQELALWRVPASGGFEDLAAALETALQAGAALGDRPRWGSPSGSAEPRFLGGFRLRPG